MRVELAAQVLSSSMAKAILARENQDLSKTAEFCSVCVTASLTVWMGEHGSVATKPDLNDYENVNLLNSTNWRFRTIFLKKGHLCYSVCQLCYQTEHTVTISSNLVHAVNKCIAFIGFISVHHVWTLMEHIKM